MDVLVPGLAAFYLDTLWRQASPAVFASDECFHAYLSEWIARRGRLPRELPEFCSGFPYFYPLTSACWAQVLSRWPASHG